MKDPEKQSKITITSGIDGMSIDIRVDVVQGVREEIPEHLREERKRKNRERWMRFPSLRMILEAADARRAAKANPPPADEANGE